MPVDLEDFYDPVTDVSLQVKTNRCKWNVRTRKSLREEPGTNKEIKIKHAKRRQILSKNNRKKNSTEELSYTERRHREVKIVPRNAAQKEYVSALNNPHYRINIAVGPAGCGKTLLAVLRAVKSLKEGEISKIVISRPAVGVGSENHGFLPGSLTEKMEPWLLPIIDIFLEYFDKKQLDYMFDTKIIEIAPLMYMRGRNFKDCFIILDEAQNTSIESMKLILTRLGNNSYIAITGDLRQRDKKYGESGLEDFIERLDDQTCGIKISRFDHEHIERDPIVKEVLRLYGEADD